MHAVSQDEIAQVRLLEEAYANNVPATETILYDGWIVRITERYSKDNSSVWPMHPGSIPAADKIEFCETLYEKRGLKCCFRLCGLPGHDLLAGRLNERGYAVEHPHWVMLRGSADSPSSAILILEVDEWLEATYRMHDADDREMIDRERRMLKSIPLPCVYAIAEVDGKSVGYGRSTLQGNYLNLENLWISPNHRGVGLGTSLINGLISIGRRSGASQVYLAVNEANTRARQLYERMGFSNKYFYQYLVAR